MNEDEIYSFEDRTYLNPTTSRDEQLSFIDTLRETQAKNTAQIRTDTYNLGSPLPSNLGGLSGAEDTFIARYQTPQTEQTVADLRTAAQQSALNQALTNLQTAYKKRYNDAVLDYQKRSATPSNTTPNTNNTDGDVSFEPTGANGNVTSGISASFGGSSSTIKPSFAVMPNGKLGVFKTGPDGRAGDFIGYADDLGVQAQLNDDPVLKRLLQELNLTGSLMTSKNKNTAARAAATQNAGFGAVVTPTAMARGAF